MARDISAVDGLVLDRHHPVAGRTTHAVTMAHAGERHNVIPGEAKWTIDLRTTDAGLAIRTHGDLHLGNVLDRDGELRLLLSLIHI